MLSFYERLGALLHDRRWVVLAVIFATLIPTGFFAPQLGFDFTPQAIFASDDELAEFSEELKSKFSYEDTLLLILVKAPEGESAIEPGVLAWIDVASDEIEKLDGVDRVESLATIGVPRDDPDNPGVLVTRPLLDKEAYDSADADRVSAALDRAQMLDGKLVSEDRSLVAIAVFLDPDKRDIETLSDTYESIQTYCHHTRPLPDGFTTSFGGIPAMRSEVVDGLAQDQLTLLPFTSLIALFVMFLLFRRVSGVILPVAAVGIGLGWTVLGMVLLNQHINIINNILPVLIFVIGCSDTVHLVARYAEETDASGGDRRVAMIRTVKHLGLACLLTSLTTAVGFLSLVISSNDILAGLGWQVAMGVGLAYIAIITVLPASMPLLKPPVSGKLASGTPGRLDRILAFVGHRVIRHPWIALTSSLLLLVACGWIGSTVPIDSFLMEAFPPDHRAQKTLRIVEDDLSGYLPVEISLRADRKQAFVEPKNFAAVAAVQEFAEQQDGVLMTESYVDFHQEMRVALIGDPAARDQLPPLDDKGRQQLFQIQELIDSAGKELGYDKYMSRGLDHARILIRTRDFGTQRTLDLAEDLADKLDEQFPESSGVTWRIAGESYVASTGINSFIRDLFYSLLAASIIIFAMMTILFRSLRAGLVSVLPNISPLVITLGYMGLVGLDMNATNVIIFAISLGLGVDDTIHFLTRFYEELPRAANVQDAVMKTFAGAGRAIVITTLILLAGLVVLNFSQFMPTRRFAELTALTLGGALVGDLVLLPAALVLFWKKPTSPSDPEPT